jgi:hypothetical protein
VKFIELGWAGRVMRIGESDLAKKVLCTKPEGRGERRRSRPKLRWCDELEVDITWVGCRNWRNKAQPTEK